MGLSQIDEIVNSLAQFSLIEKRFFEISLGNEGNI